MATIYLQKFKSLCQEMYLTLGQKASFVSTPYEGRGGVVPTFIAAGNKDYLELVDGNPSNQTVNQISSFQSPVAGKNARMDARIISIDMQGSGGVLVFECYGDKKKLQRAFETGRTVGVWASEHTDSNVSNSPERLCQFSAQIGLFFMSPEGVSTSTSTGREGITGRAVTWDRFLAIEPMQKMPYILAAAAYNEIANFSSMARTSSALGFTPVGSGAFTGNPLAGFGQFKDIGTLSPAALLSPGPPNYEHFLANCGAQYALYEVMSHHSFVERGNGLKSIREAFPCTFDFTNAETDVISIELGPGTVWDAVGESTKHYGARFWVDHLGRFFYQPDYCAQAYGATAPSLVLRGGKSMLGELQVATGPMDTTRVNSVTVEGSGFGNTMGEGPGLGGRFEGGALGYRYPPGQPIGGGPGADIWETGYIGKQVKRYGRYLYSKHSQMTTCAFEMPYISVGLALFNRVIGIEMKSRAENYDWKNGSNSPIGIDVGYLAVGAGLNPAGPKYGANGKLFSVEQVSVQWQGSGDEGYYTSHVQCREIIPLLS